MGLCESSRNKRRSGVLQHINHHVREGLLLAIAIVVTAFLLFEKDIFSDGIEGSCTLHTPYYSKILRLVERQTDQQPLHLHQDLGYNFKKHCCIDTGFAIIRLLYLRFGADAAPTNCNGQTFSSETTLLFVPSETPTAASAGYVVALAQCVYTSLVVKSDAANAPIFNTALILTDLKATKISFEKNLFFAEGSNITITRTTITGPLYANLMMEKAAFSTAGLWMSSTFTMSSTTYTDSTFDLDGVTITTSANAGVLISSVTMQNTVFTLRNSFIRTTSTSSYYGSHVHAMRWSSSPMFLLSPTYAGGRVRNPSNAVNIVNNSFVAEDKVVLFETQNDWERTNTTAVLISRNYFEPRRFPTSPALRLFVGSPNLFTFTDDNVFNGGSVEVRILRESRNLLFQLHNSTIDSLTYTYETQQNVSYNERLSFENVIFRGYLSIALPTSTNASVFFNGCRGATAAWVVLNFRALDGGSVSLINSIFANTLSKAFSLTATFLAYKLDYSQKNTTIAGCSYMKFNEIYYSNMSIIGGSYVGCTSLEGQFRSSKFIVSDSTVSPSIITPIVMNFVNDWRDSSLDIVRSVVSTGNAALTSNHHLIHFTGKLESIQHTYFGNTFSNWATYSTTSGIAPHRCIVGYSRKYSMAAYPAITDTSSVKFIGGNKATLVAEDTYLLYVNVQGGELIFDESNSASNVGSLVAAGRFYVNMIAPSKDTIVLTLKNIVGFSQADIVRYLAVNPTYYEAISIKDSSIAIIQLFIHTAIGLTLTVENVLSSKQISVQGVNIKSSTLVFKGLATPSLYQSIAALYTSVIEVMDSRPNMIEHIVTSLDGCLIRFVNNVLSTKYLRLKGGLYQSQMLIQNNTISSTSYSLYLDYFHLAQSIFDVVNNTASAYSGFFMSQSTCLAGTDMNFIGNRITRNYNCFWSTEGDLREGCSLRFSRNEFTTRTSDGYLFRLHLTGARIIHDDTNRLHLGKLYFYNKVSSRGNYFALRSSSYGTHNPNTFEWLYYNSIHTAVGDTIQISDVYFAGSLTIQFPIADDAYVRLTQIRTTALSLHHREATKSTLLIVNSQTTEHTSLSTSYGCTGCLFDVYNTTAGTYMQFAGSATSGSAFVVRHSAMQYFISSTAFTNRSGLRLASSIISSRGVSSTVALGGGWSNNSYLEMDSCMVFAIYQAVTITQNTATNSTHKFTNNVLTTLMTGNTFKEETVQTFGCLVYVWPSGADRDLASSIGLDSQLIIQNNTISLHYIDSYVLYVTSTDGGRVVMENGNTIRSTFATSSLGRIYINSIGTDPRGADGGLGHTLVLTNIPSLYSFQVVRKAATKSYNERFELHNVGVAYASIYTADSYNLKIYYSNITLAYDSYMYGTMATAASITFRGIRGCTLYQQLTAHVSSNTDFIGNVLTSKLYHSALSSAGSIVTFRENTLSASFVHIQGAIFDSQFVFDRNRITAAADYGLYVESFTVRNAAMTITNNFIMSSSGSAIVWTKSPVYACGDVYLHGNSLSGFEMLGQDAGVGGTVWFRYNILVFQAARAHHYVFRITLGAGGRMDYDSTNTIKLGGIHVYHTYHTTRNNVFVVSNKSIINRFEWLYSSANGTSINDTIAIDDTIVSSDIQISISAMIDGQLCISNSRILYAYVRINKGDDADVAIYNTTVSSHLSLVPPSGGVSEFRNSSLRIQNSNILTSISINGNFFCSTVYVSNVTCNQLWTGGVFGRNASLVINKTIVTMSSPYSDHAASIQSVFDDGALIVERSTFISSNYKAFVLTQSTRGSSLHLFTDNLFSVTGSDTMSTVEDAPRFCAFCYSNGSTFPAVSGLGESAVIFRGNSFNVRHSANNAFSVHVTVGDNGRVHFDETNRNVQYAAGGAICGLFRFYMKGATAWGNYINISGWGQRIHSVLIDYLSAVSNNDTIEISDVLSVGRIALTFKAAGNLTVIIRNLSIASSESMTVSADNIRNNSVVDISGITTSQTITIQMRLTNASVVAIRNSFVGIVQYRCRTLDQSKFVMESNLFTTFTTTPNYFQSTTVESFGELHFLNNTNINNPTSVLQISRLTVISGGRVIIRNNALISSNTGSALSWDASPVSAGGEVYIIDNAILGFHMTTSTDLMGGGVFILRNNTLSARTFSTFYALIILICGGRVDFDVSNRILSGYVDIVHYASSRNNHIIVANSSLGGTFSLKYSSVNFNSVSDIYGVVNTQMTALSVVMFSAINTSLCFDSIRTTGTVALSFTSATDCNVALRGSVLATALYLTVSSYLLGSIFGIHETTVGGVFTISGQLNSSLVYIRGSAIGAFSLRGAISNGTLLIHDSKFTSYSSDNTILIDALWYGGLLEFVRSSIVSVACRSLVMGGLIYGHTAHRFIDSVIISRSTSQATTGAPGACALCFANLKNTLFPSIGENATLTVRNTTLMSSFVHSYLLYVRLEGGTVDIDTNNVVKGVPTPDVGKVFVGLGPRSKGTRVVVANMGSIGTLEVVRTQGTPVIQGTDETIAIHNVTTITTGIDLGATTRRINLQVSNVTAKTSFTLLGTNVEVSDLLIVNTTTASFTHSITNLSSKSRLVVNGTNAFTTMTLSSTARFGSIILVGDSFSLSGSVTLRSAGLFSESEFIFEGNDVATAAETPFTIAGLTVEGSSRVIFRQNQFRASGPSYYALLWSSTLTVKNSLIYFDSNTFGIPNLVSTATINGFVVTSYAFGAGSIVVFRRNVFTTPTATPLVFQAQLGGGSIDFDGSNSLSKGRVQIYFSTRSIDRGNRVIIRGAELGYLYCTMTTTSLSSVDDIYIFENVKVTSTVGIVFGACLNCTVRVQNVSSLGISFFAGDLVGALVSFKNITTVGSPYITVSSSIDSILELLGFNAATGVITFSSSGAMVRASVLIENVTAGGSISIETTSSIDSNFTLRNVEASHATAALGYLSFVTRTATIGSMLEISNVKLTGALTLSAAAMNKSVLLVSDAIVKTDSKLSLVTSSTFSRVTFERVFFKAATFNLEGLMGVGARVLLLNNTIENGALFVAVGANANASLEIKQLSITTMLSSAVKIYGPWKDDSRISVRDSSISALSSSSLGYHQSNCAAHVSIINTYITTVSGLALSTTSPGDFVTKSLEIIGNDFTSTNAEGGGVAIIAERSIVSVIIANNKFNVAPSLSIPPSVDPSSHDRVASCNENKFGTAMNLTAVSLTNSPCHTSLTRCQGFENVQVFWPSSYSRPPFLVLGAADAVAPACVSLHVFCCNAPGLVAVMPETSQYKAQEEMRHIALVNATIIPTSIVTIPQIVVEALAEELSVLADEAKAKIISALELAQLFFFGTRSTPDELIVTESIFPSIDSSSSCVEVSVPLKALSAETTYARTAEHRRFADSFENAFGGRYPLAASTFNPDREMLFTRREVYLCFPLLLTTTPPPTTAATTVTFPITTDAVTTARATITITTVTTATFTTLAKTTRPTTTTMPTTTLGFSEIFDDEGMSEPITTTSYQGTYIVTDETGASENPDVATIPNRFTPPPITEDMSTIPDAFPTVDTANETTENVTFSPANHSADSSGNTTTKENTSNATTSVTSSARPSPTLSDSARRTTTGEPMHHTVSTSITQSDRSHSSHRTLSSDSTTHTLISKPSSSSSSSFSFSPSFSSSSSSSLSFSSSARPSVLTSTLSSHSLTRLNVTTASRAVSAPISHWLPLHSRTNTKLVYTCTASVTRNQTPSASHPHTRTRTHRVLVPIPPPSRIEQLAGSMLVAVGPVITVAAVAGVSGGQLSAMNAMTRLANCDEDGEDDTPVLVHPLRFSLFSAGSKAASEDPSLGQYAAAAISNGAIIPFIMWLLVYWALPYVATLVAKEVSMDTVRSFLGWPCVMVLPLVTLAEGTTLSVIMSWRSGVSHLLLCGVVGFLSISLAVGWWARALIVFVPRTGLSLEPNEIPAPASSSVSWLRAALDKALEPTHCWVVAAPSAPLDDGLNSTNKELDECCRVFVDEFPAGTAVEMSSRPTTTRRGTSSSQSNKTAKDEEEKPSVELRRAALLERYGGLVGDRRWYYAEVLSFMCSIVVGVAEGMPSDGGLCGLRAAVAMLALVSQCLCGCATLVRLEFALQLLITLCVLPMSVLAVCISSGLGERIGMKNDGTRIMTAMSYFAVVANMIGIVQMTCQTVVGVALICVRCSSLGRQGQSNNNNNNNNNSEVPLATLETCALSEPLLLPSLQLQRRESSSTSLPTMTKSSFSEVSSETELDSALIQVPFIPQTRGASNEKAVVTSIPLHVPQLTESSVSPLVIRIGKAPLKHQEVGRKESTRVEKVLDNLEAELSRRKKEEEEKSEHYRNFQWVNTKDYVPYSSFPEGLGVKKKGARKP